RMRSNSTETIELVTNGYNGRSPSGDTQETVVETSAATPVEEFGAKRTSKQMKEDMADAAFNADPFNQQELIHTLKGRELYLFVVFYLIAVAIIVYMFEFFMPVVLNPNYPNDP
ncbi:hypothetical protein PFISCL1PPCAC_7973, partial [Pristionchus fissidentatus]